MGITKVVEVVDSRGTLKRAVLVQPRQSIGTLDDPGASTLGLGTWQLESGEVLNHDAANRAFTVVQTGEVLRHD